MTWFQQSPAATALARRVWTDAAYKDIRQVPKQGRVRKYKLETLSVGEAILVPYEGGDPYRVSRRLIQYTKKWRYRHGQRFSTERCDAGILVRRMD